MEVFMLPFEIIKDWGSCTDVDDFMDHVLNAGDKLPSSNRPTDTKLQQVARTSFEERARNAYNVVAKYLEENSGYLNRLYEPHLQRLAENVEMIKLYGGSETPELKQARMKTEKIIQGLQKKVANLKEETIPSIDAEQIMSVLAGVNANPSDVKLIIAQYSYIPLIQIAVKEIARLYHEMIGETPKSRGIIYQKINIQLQNLVKFVHMMDNFLKRQDPVSQAALAQLAPENIKSFSEIQPYLLGEQVLKDDVLRKIEGQIFEIAKKTEVSLKKSRASLQQQRSESPITTVAIEKQAGLQESHRQAKTWAGEQNQLAALGTSVNQVFQLKSADGLETAAYYKESTGKGDNAEYMEKLMWDSAVIMGFEKQFVATSSTTLRTKDHFGNVGTSEKIWDASHKELVDKTVSGSRKGGFQPAQTGNTLLEYEEDNDPNKRQIPHLELVHGVLASCVMGFFDGHRKNILVDASGNLKFFDNASSMPHSNGCILWGGKRLRSSFRSGLLNVPESHFLPLTNQDRQLLTDEIGKCKRKYQDLKKFYENPETQTQINKLPDKWFQTERVLKAMEDRIYRLESALANPKINTLCDFALASQPDLRFHLAMTYIFYFGTTLPLQYTNSNYIQYMDMVGLNDVDTCIYKCSKLGFDPVVVKEWCDNPNLSFNEVMRLVNTYPNRINKVEAKKHATAIVKDLRSSALPDFKDW